MRRTASLRLLVVLGTVLVLGSGLARSDDDEIYTCYDSQGVPSFQNDPCPELPAKANATATPDPIRSTRPPAVKAPIPVRPKPTPPAVETRPTAPISQRRTTSWMVIARERNMPPVGTRDLGKQTFPTRIDGAPMPPSFVSPEATWLTFLAALESGDRGRAAACLTPAARKTLRTLDDLRRLLNSFTRIDNVGDLGPYWSIQGVREKQRPKWILFEEMPAGEWKIAGI